MPMFWLMKLSFVSLKGSAVSSSTFWGVYGFSMSLGNPSDFGIFRHVYFCSHVKVALLAYLHCHQPPTCPWNLWQCFCFWIPPCTAGGRLLGRGLCGSSLNSRTLPSASQTCVGFPQPHELARCVAGRLHLFRFGSPARSLCHRASTHGFQLSPPTLCIAGLVCTCLASAGSPSMSRGFCALLSAP